MVEESNRITKRFAMTAIRPVGCILLGLVLASSFKKHYQCLSRPIPNNAQPEDVSGGSHLSVQPTVLVA
jgi:hypothetical protein